MSTKIRIKVTKEILTKSANCGIDGTPNAINCAFSLAIRDIFPKAAVGLKDIFPNSYRDDHFSISPKMSRFISKFDNSSPEERIDLPEEEFELEIPDWALAPIGNGEIEETKKIISSSKTLELV